MRPIAIALFLLVGTAALAQHGCATGCVDAPDLEPEPSEYKMTALTITAVDTGANTLTITGHGLNTGDGPAATRNIGGALPGGLAAVTDYFVIRVDANTLKLATSSSNANAGTAIDITSAGSGTNILEVGVPFRRPRTYAAGVRLESADLNANFDTWAALHALLTAQSQSVWTGVSLAGDLTVAGQFNDGLVTDLIPITAPAVASDNSGALNDVVLSGGTIARHFPVRMDAGRKIRAVRARVKDSATGPTKVRLTFRTETDGVASIVGTPVISSGSGSNQTLVLSGLSTLVTSLSTYTISLDLQTGSTLSHIYALEVDSDRLP